MSIASELVELRMRIARPTRRGSLREPRRGMWKPFALWQRVINEVSIFSRSNIAAIIPTRKNLTTRAYTSYPSSAPKTLWNCSSMASRSSPVLSAADSLSRLANFSLMAAVFQLDLAILLGQLRAAVFTPYTIICIIPALAGLVGDRYLSKCKYDLQIGSRYFLIGKLANALLIAGVS